MTDPQICPACSVKIVDDVVHFSFGKLGTIERLYARVCQYAKKEGCINQGIDPKAITGNDRYAEF